MLFGCISLSLVLLSLQADEVNLTQPEPEREPSNEQANPGTSLDETYAVRKPFH